MRDLQVLGWAVEDSRCSIYEEANNACSSKLEEFACEMDGLTTDEVAEAQSHEDKPDVIFLDFVCFIHVLRQKRFNEGELKDVNPCSKRRHNDPSILNQSPVRDSLNLS